MEYINNNSEYGRNDAINIPDFDVNLFVSSVWVGLWHLMK